MLDQCKDVFVEEDFDKFFEFGNDNVFDNVFDLSKSSTSQKSMLFNIFRGGSQFENLDGSLVGGWIQIMGIVENTDRRWARKVFDHGIGRKNNQWTVIEIDLG